MADQSSCKRHPQQAGAFAAEKVARQAGRSTAHTAADQLWLPPVSNALSFMTGTDKS